MADGSKPPKNGRLRAILLACGAALMLTGVIFFGTPIVSQNLPVNYLPFGGPRMPDYYLSATQVHSPDVPQTFQITWSSDALVLIFGVAVCDTIPTENDAGNVCQFNESSSQKGTIIVSVADGKYLVLTDTDGGVLVSVIAWHTSPTIAAGTGVTGLGFLIVSSVVERRSRIPSPPTP